MKMNMKMNVSDNLNQQKLREILLSIYKKGYESEKIQVTDFIEEIKNQVISATNTVK